MKPLILTVLLLATAIAVHGQLENCPRGEATPILKKAAYPKSTFRIAKNGFTATETAQLGRGDRLIVKTWGCEYYVLTFRFVTNRGRIPVDLYYWFRSAVRRMTQIYPNIQAPLDIKKGVQRLKSHIDTQRKSKIRRLMLGEKIMFGGDEQDPNRDDIPQNVSVERVQKLRHGRYAVEISFTAGPL